MADPSSPSAPAPSESELRALLDAGPLDLSRLAQLAARCGRPGLAVRIAAMGGSLTCPRCSVSFPFRQHLGERFEDEDDEDDDDDDWED